MERTRFGADRVLVLPGLVLLVGSLPVAGSRVWLNWVVLVPVALLVWVLRARVDADREGLTVCNGLGRRRYAWTQVEGFDVPARGPVRLLLAGGARVPLTTVSRDRLRALVALGGRA